jgi:CheY-like chemotaxis protein
MKILLIEDDKFFQNFYVLKLREQQLEVEAASDGVEGLEKAKIFLPDIILLDMIMPKMDGFDVLETLQSDTNLQKIPVLVFSTLGNEKDIERAKQLGAKDYVNKSFFDFDTLLTKINKILSSGTN